jgi:Bacterial toxin 23
LTNTKNHIIICLLCLSTLSGYAQLFSGSNWGFNIGAVSALGNRFQRIGLTFQGYYHDNFAQFNAEVRVYHNFKNLGPPRHYNELVTAAGLVVGYGKKNTEHNSFVSSVSNQTGYTNSVGYSYNVYFNRIKTTQQTGIIALQFNKVSIISENDIFARPILDRFRTGAILVQYQYKDIAQFAINCTLWTGKMGKEITNNKDFPYVGYLDTTGGVYTRYSHGLLSGQCKMNLDHGQTAQANIGIDAEQVRNFLQNRLVHDLTVALKKGKPQNCHLPMLDTNGDQYLYRPGQEIKPAHFYWNVFTGAGSFY